MSLVDQRILTPIRPMKTFAFDQMQDAFRYMRSATHIGKIVVSMQGQQDVMVQVCADQDLPVDLANASISRLVPWLGRFNLTQKSRTSSSEA